MTERALDAFLAALETRLARAITAVPACHPALPLLRAGGKRLRARVLWLSAAALRPCRDDVALVRAAAAIELAHLASLVHDDIVDGSATRRGVATVHRRHGIVAAVRCGTALLHLASALGTSLPVRARHAVARAALAVARGQMRELRGAYALASPRERLAVMRDKTAAFFELAAAVAAILVDASGAETRAVCRFARCFGIAFQITDDVLDLVGDPGRLGRPNGADLQNGVFTLPVILAAGAEGSAGDALRLLLAGLRHDPAGADVAAGIALVCAAGGADAAVAASRRWHGRAVAALEVLRPSAARSVLATLATTASGIDRLPVDAEPAPQAAQPGGRRFPRRPAETAWPEHPRSLAPAIDPPGAGAGAGAPHLDAHVLADLQRVDAELVVCAQAALANPDAAALTRALVRVTTPDAGNGDAATAARAFALAQALVANERLARDPVAAITASDCLHAVALARIAHTPRRVHARQAAAFLATLAATPALRAPSSAAAAHRRSASVGAPSPTPAPLAAGVP